MDKIYKAGAGLAAIFMILIALLTLVQIVGRGLGLRVPDAGELAGYCMAASLFLALAYTFRTGGHIRVNLLLHHVGPKSRDLLERWCMICAVIIGGMFAAFSVKLVYDSYIFNDVSTGMMPVPLWIPQLSMAVGAIIFEIALIEEAIHVFRGGQPRYEEPAGSENFTE